MKQLFTIVISALLTWVFMHSTGAYMSKNTSQEITPPVEVTKCDSIMLANDSLSLEIIGLQDRVAQYKLGLGFLKDKDKGLYDYVINAGRLKFKERYEDSY